MSNVIYVDFPTAITAQDADLPVTMPQPPTASMPTTVSLGQIIMQLRSGAYGAEAALQQMRDGSAELSRLSAEMKEHTGALVGQIGTVQTALGAFGQAVRNIHAARRASGAR